MNPASSIKAAFQDRNVILTGGASGLGRELATLMARGGAKVFVLDVDEAGLSGLLEIDASPGILRPKVVDVGNFTAYQMVIDEILKEVKAIDFLFNNAGVTLMGEAQKIPFESSKWLLDTNLMGVVHGTHLIYPLMIAQGRGTIINTASIAGATGYATAAAYTASKAAILEFTRSLRAEAKCYGVRVVAACPGYVDSALFDQKRIIGADRGELIRKFPVTMMSPATAARKLLRGLLKQQRIIVFPLNAKVLWGIYNWCPLIIAPLHGSLLKVFRKK